MGDVICPQQEPAKVLPSGGYGKVWKVQNKKDSKEYALKEMTKALIISKKSVVSIVFEIELLRRISNPFVCNMCYAFQDFENLYLAMEIANGGDLRYHLFKNKVFNEKETKFIACCLIIGLEYLHSLAILHRDIKPENVLFDSKGYIKITDFGIARTFSPNNSNDTSGTPGYMAPEVAIGKQHGTAVDFFALGVVLYELMIGRRPYGGVQRKEYRDNVLACQVQIKPEEKPKAWSEDSRDFINKLIQRKEESRLGNGKNGPQSIKEHSWFKDIDWNEIYEQRAVAPFIPANINENFDEKYLESCGINEKYKNDVEVNTKTLRNKSVQDQFKGYYFDKDKMKATTSRATTFTNN